MPIVYHESTKTFHLYNNDISYVIQILKNGMPGQLYFGKRVRDKEDFSYLLELRPRPFTPCVYEGDLSFSLEHIKQENPSFGHGDMRQGAYTVRQSDGSTISEFVYHSHEIYEGKKGLPGLPALYVEEEGEAESLDLVLTDSVSKTKLVLSYTIFANYSAVARHTVFTQYGEESVTLERCMSMCLDLPDMDYDMIELTGAWSRERSVKQRHLEHGLQSVYSLRGNSSHVFNPFTALKRSDTNENSGEVLGFSLIYSGSFTIDVDVDTYDTTRVMLGIQPETFSWELKQNESFTSPEAVIVYSEKGMNGMSQTFHELYRHRLARGKWRDKPRPLLVNNWEGTYFDFDEEKLLRIAECAREIGLELFVLDDGWFGKRNHDRAGLGDWIVNYEKLPHGLSGLSHRLKDMGLQFGIWIEPEMVNKDSDLYRSHPEWVLSVPHRYMSHGRNQYVLDFSRRDVVDYIYSMLEKVFTEGEVSYVKWDMNRTMSEVYSCVTDPGEVYHRYILGVYDLYERLIQRFPDILFESCASGGGRFDPGMLYYAPQCWTSDDTDAVERLKIQYGTSYVYPLSSMGSHVSAIPNHQLLRNVPLSTRANTAYFGTFGYELDLTKLTESEKVDVKKQVSFMKQYRELIQFGTFYRLCSPFAGNECAWMVVSKDKKTALVGYYRVLETVNGPYRRIKLSGLNETMMYHVSILNREFGGDELMHIGLITSDSSSGENKEKYNGENGDYQSRIYVIQSV